MTKKTKKLEKENTSIKAKCELMNKNILEMAEEVSVQTFVLSSHPSPWGKKGGESLTFVHYHPLKEEQVRAGTRFRKQAAHQARELVPRAPGRAQFAQETP